MIPLTSSKSLPKTRNDWSELALQYRHQPERPKSFEELLQFSPESALRSARDFHTEIKSLGSKVGVIAIHGGNLEPGTAELAEAIAGSSLSSYIFRSHLPVGDDSLWVTSARFNDPDLLDLLKGCETVFSIHGCKDVPKTLPEKIIYVSGRDKERRDRVIQMLRGVGFNSELDSLFPGRHKSNPCNLGSSGMGVQLEITRSLRDEIVQHCSEISSRGNGIPEIEKLFGSLRGLVWEFEGELGGGLS